MIHGQDSCYPGAYPSSVLRSDRSTVELYSENAGWNTPWKRDSVYLSTFQSLEWPKNQNQYMWEIIRSWACVKVNRLCVEYITLNRHLLSPVSERGDYTVDPFTYRTVNQSDDGNMPLIKCVGALFIRLSNDSIHVSYGFSLLEAIRDPQWESSIIMSHHCMRKHLGKMKLRGKTSQDTRCYRDMKWSNVSIRGSWCFIPGIITDSWSIAARWEGSTDEKVLFQVKQFSKMPQSESQRFFYQHIVELWFFKYASRRNLSIPITIPSRSLTRNRSNGVLE